MIKLWKWAHGPLPDRCNPRRKTSLALASAACGLALLFVSCGSWKATDEPRGLQIVQVQSITGQTSATSGSTTGCTVPATATTSTQSSGVLDVYLPDNSYPPYLLPVLLANDLDPVGGTKATEMNNITVTHFSVTLSAPGMTWDASCPASFDSPPFTIVLAPGSTAGYALEIIESQHSLCLLQALNPQPSDSGPRHVLVSAQVTAKGSHGGTTIASAPFTYTVDVCTGCEQDSYTDPTLIRYRYPAGYPACAALQGTNLYQGSPCLPPGQDAPILCCGYTDAAGKARAACPGYSTNTSTTTGTATSTSTTTGP